MLPSKRVPEDIGRIVGMRFIPFEGRASVHVPARGPECDALSTNYFFTHIWHVCLQDIFIWSNFCFVNICVVF